SITTSAFTRTLVESSKSRILEVSADASGKFQVSVSDLSGFCDTWVIFCKTGCSSFFVCAARKPLFFSPFEAGSRVAVFKNSSFEKGLIFTVSRQFVSRSKNKFQLRRSGKSYQKSIES